MNGDAADARFDEVVGGRKGARRQPRLQYGEVVGLLGTNGAGKRRRSTEVGLTSLIPPGVECEDVTIFPCMHARGRDRYFRMSRRSSASPSSEHHGIWRTRSRFSGRRARCRELLAELNLTPLASSPAYTLSGGERRRAEITRALVISPKFLLLDEPFAGIDPIAITDIQKIIFHLKDRGIGVLITDHNVRETLRITDRAYIVHDGGIFHSGTPETLAADEEVRRVYLGTEFRLD